MSIASELETLAANKAAIKAAIEAKSPATAPTDALAQWPIAIASIGARQGWVYGYVIDESDSNPATRVSYIEDNANFSPLYMDFANDALVWGSWKSWVEEYFRPAMLTSAGVVDYYLDPDDLSKKADGVTASDVANTSYDGNAMLIVKPIYYNISRIGTTQIRVRFSNYKQGDDWYNWTHLKSDGTYAEFCGWPLFQGTVVSSKLRSIATGAVPQGNNTQANEYAYATANGSNWYTTTWADEMMFRLLFPLLCKSTDCQSIIGGGSLVSSLTLTNGQLITKGAFWGKSTVDSSSVAYGCKYLYMENVWGERWRRPCGVIEIDGRFYVKLTPSMIDGTKSTVFKNSTSSSDYTANYVRTTAMMSFGVIQKVINMICVDPRWAALPNLADTSVYNDYCDAAWTNESNGVYGILFGGSSKNGQAGGLFAFTAYYDPSNSSWDKGASLSYHFF